MSHRVVITGVGMITPLGNCKNTWNGVIDGCSGITPLKFGYDIEPYKAALNDDCKFPIIGGQIKDFVFNPQALGIDPEKGKKLDRTAQLAVVAAKKAVEVSGLNLSQEENVPVLVGSAYGGGHTIHDEHEILFGHRFGSQMGENYIGKIRKKKITTFYIPRIISSGDAAHVGITIGATGSTFAVNAACASGAMSIGEALWMIRSGRAKVAIAGGVETSITPAILCGYASARVYSCREVDSPGEAMCPFDRKRDGFVVSEGSGMVVLEELERAKERGANILGEIIGFYSNADAFHITRPDSERLRQCIQGTFEDAKINREDIVYVNAHGTSTLIGDVNEVTALGRVFDGCMKKPCVSSTKSCLGHMIGATGAVELILTALAVQKGIVPPTINLNNPDPECNEFDFAANVAREIEIPIAMSISYGFGGLNCCLIVKKI